IDISPAALNVAKRNREYYDLAQVELWESDLFDNVNESYDIIYSNPPYITTEAMEHLDKSVKEYEPYLALHGGRDGLYFYKRIIAHANHFLKPNGYLVFEIGYDQRDQVEELLLNYHFKNIKIIYDYQDHPRVVLAQKGE